MFLIKIVVTSLLLSNMAWAQVPAPAFKPIEWEELIPKGWDPYARFKAMNLGMLGDEDPRVQKMMRELREALDQAPTNPLLAGLAVKIPGYVVPLEEVKGALKEFLLVPYFGACIHTPPPPANQIIHVVLEPPAKDFRAMDAVWVSGTLKPARQDSAMGTSGYRMQAVAISRYTAPSRP
jgi:uncharacterized protein